MAKPKFLGKRFGSTEDLPGRLRTVAEASALLVLPATALGRGVGRYVAVRTAKGAQGILMDPIGTHRRVSTAIKVADTAMRAGGTYKFFDDMKKYKSSGSSSRAYQQNGSPGGTKSYIAKRAALLAARMAIDMYAKRNWTPEQWTASRKRYCPPGYIPNYDKLGRRRGCKKISKSRRKK